MTEGESLDELFQLGTTYCQPHGIVEVTTRATHMVCLECGHAFQTAHELLSAYNAKVVEVSRKPPSDPAAPCAKGIDPCGDPRWSASLLATSTRDVHCCPLCDHSF